MQYFLLGFIVVDLLNGVSLTNAEQIRLDGKQVIFGKNASGMSGLEASTSLRCRPSFCYIQAWRMVRNSLNHPAQEAHLPALLRKLAG